MLSKSFVNDLKIFCTTWLADCGSPFLLNWLATFSTRVMYSVSHSLSFIFKSSNSPLRGYKWTCLMWSFPLYATFRISHAYFEDATFAIFSKPDSSTTLYKMYKTDLSFTCVFLNVEIWATVWSSSSLYS